MQKVPPSSTKHQSVFSFECYRVLISLRGGRTYRSTVKPELRAGKMDMLVYDPEEDLKIRITFGWPVPSCVTVTAFTEVDEFGRGSISAFVELTEPIEKLGTMSIAELAEMSRRSIVPEMNKLADWLVV